MFSLVPICSGINTLPTKMTKCDAINKGVIVPALSWNYIIESYRK